MRNRGGECTYVLLLPRWDGPSNQAGQKTPPTPIRLPPAVLAQREVSQLLVHSFLCWFLVHVEPPLSINKIPLGILGSGWSICLHNTYDRSGSRVPFKASSRVVEFCARLVTWVVEWWRLDEEGSIEVGEWDMIGERSMEWEVAWSEHDAMTS